MNKKKVDSEKSILEGKAFAILAYMPFLCIIPLIFKRDNDFVLSHGRQGLVIFVGEIGVFILSIVFPWIMKLGMFILLVLSFFGIIEVIKGKYISLPIISNIADKISI